MIWYLFLPILVHILHLDHHTMCYVTDTHTHNLYTAPTGINGDRLRDQEFVYVRVPRCEPGTNLEPTNLATLKTQLTWTLAARYLLISVFPILVNMSAYTPFVT